MSMNWKMSGVKDYENLCFVSEGVNDKGDELFKLAPVADALVWLSLFVGYPAKSAKLGIKGHYGIREDNWKEYFKRIALYEKHVNVILQKRDKESGEISDRPISAADVKAHIGLWSNGDMKSESEFKKDLLRIMYEKVESEVFNQLKDLDG